MRTEARVTTKDPFVEAPLALRVGRCCKPKDWTVLCRNSVQGQSNNYEHYCTSHIFPPRRWHTSALPCVKAQRGVQILRIVCRPGGAGGGRPRPTCVAPASVIEGTETTAISTTTATG